MSNSDPTIAARGESLAEDGLGIAFAEGTELRVPDLLPGEQALVQIEHRSQHKGRAWARITERRGPLSSSRSTPACPAYGQCGGCAWQHLSYAAQLEQKRQRVRAALALSLADPPPVPPPLPAPGEHAYRNKGKYVFGTGPVGLVLGAYRPRSHDVVSTLGCQIVEPAIDEVATALHKAASASGIPVYSEQVRSPGLRYAIVRSNRVGQVLVTIVCSTLTSEPALAALAASLQQHHRVCGVLRCNNDLHGGRLLTEEIIPLTGQSFLAESICGVALELGPSAFWQVNREQAEIAYLDLAAALELAPESTVYELYAGVGGISFALAKAGHRVVAIERDREATSAGRIAADGAGLQALLEFREQDATQLAATDLDGADALVVDPPRKGLGQRGLAILCDAKPAKIAYLSCGPDSLARDLSALVKAGYHIDALRLYDFMPGTAQVETLAILRR